MALKQVLILLAAICAVLGRPTEVDDAPVKSSGTPEMSKCDTESDQLGAGSAVNYYPLGRPMAFIPVYYLPPHGIVPNLKQHRPMQKEGDGIPTMVYSSPKMRQNMKPEKASPSRDGQMNVEGLPAIPSSMIAQPVQSTKNLDKPATGSLGNVEEPKSRQDASLINRESSSTVLPSESGRQQESPHQSSMDLESDHSPLVQGESTGPFANLDQEKIPDREPRMNPQLSPVDSEARMPPGTDLPISKNAGQPQVMGQEGLVSLAEPSPLAIPRLKRTPQFGRLPPYGYDDYTYDGYPYDGYPYDGYPYGGYGGYDGYPGHGPYDYPFYGDEIIDVDIRLI